MKGITRIAAALGALAIGLTTATSAQANPAPQQATTAAAARVATDFSSIFAAQQPSLSTSGWSSCGAITWSVDTRGLSRTQATAQTTALTKAFAAWGRASGLSFQQVGTIPVVYDEATYRTAPVKGEDARTRHIYVGFVTDAASTVITRTNPGFAGPGAVSSSSQIIDNGYAFFSIDYVKSIKTSTAQGKAKAQNLYLHEIGHALGLGHASLTENVMHPIVTSQKALGAGDVTGGRTLTKSCTI